MEYNNDFRYHLEIGRIAEQKLADILENKKIEIKYDLLASKTGNIAIEYACRNEQTGTEKLSGISITESDYYCYIIANTQCQDIYIMIETNKLKELCREYYLMNKIKKLGDSNLSKAVIIPLKDLFSIKVN